MTNKEYFESLIKSGETEKVAQEMNKAALEFLAAERKEPESAEPENTVVMTFEVTNIIKGEPPMPETLHKAAASRAELIKDMTNADYVTAAKIQCFVRGAK